MTSAVELWDRRHLLVVFGAVATVFALLVVGFVYAVATSRAGSDSSQVHSSRNVGGEGSDRDAIAAAPMVHGTERADVTPLPAALHPNAPIKVPLATTVGHAGVSAGFPHTPEGALGQLAAIDSFAIQKLSQKRAREVYRAWAAPGADYGDWFIAETIQAFQTRTGTGDADPSVHMTLTPVAAQIKGTDGPDWTLACVQFDMRITFRAEGRIGFGHCERMEWSDGRWRIDGGEVPVQGPSTWPGSERSAEAGWRPWRDADERR